MSWFLTFLEFENNKKQYTQIQQAYIIEKTDSFVKVGILQQPSLRWHLEETASSKNELMDTATQYPALPSSD